MHLKLQLNIIAVKMSKPWLRLGVGMVAWLLLLLPSFDTVEAQSITPPKVIISQLKVTSNNGQFIALHNNSSTTVDLQTLQLQYFNNYDLSKATSSKLIPLSGNLEPGAQVVINDGSMTMCYQAMVFSASLSFSSTSGFLQVSHFASPATPSTTTVLDDFIGWSKIAALGAQTLPASTNDFLNRQSLASVTSPGTGAWQTVTPGTADPCSLSSFLYNNTGTAQLVEPTQPPAIIVSLSDAGSGLSNNGLMAPVITEVLPNPAEPLTDADDEYVEIYNPNEREFDLSGYGLQTSLTSSRVYKFPSGTTLSPKAFQVFTSADYNFSLSNSGGHIKLMNPSGEIISQSEPYSAAKEGQSWALANGRWYWTVASTPGRQNTVDQSGSGTASTAKNGTRSSAVKAAASGSVSQPTAALAGSDPLHPWTIAVVGVAVILYSGYEYRNDVANQLHRFRRYREARRNSRLAD